jgi:flavin-binding protein dodecin
MSATSDQSFEDAINQAVNRATSTLRNDQNVEIQDNRISAYKVNVAITFVLEEGEQPA